MSSKFGALAIDTTVTSRMPLLLPGDVDPITDEADQVGYIEFLPWDAKPGRDFDAKRNRENIGKGFRAKSRAELLAEAQNEDQAAITAQRVALLVTGWHLVGPDRKVIDLPFSPENVADLFTDPETAWIRRAAVAYVQNEANFMKRSSKT